MYELFRKSSNLSQSYTKTEARRVAPRNSFFTDYRLSWSKVRVVFEDKGFINGLHERNLLCFVQSLCEVFEVVLVRVLSEEHFTEVLNLVVEVIYEL